MPAIPLYTDPSYPDASHAVRAPGGYEWWTFDAEDAAGDTQLFVTLVEGHETDPGYLRAYARFRRRPTRVPPPVPRGYAFACFALYRGGRLAHRSITHYPASQVEASTDRLHVRVGPNCCRATENGVQIEISNGMSGAIQFKPLLPARLVERRWLTRAAGGAEHHWIVADPLCEVSARVTVTGVPDHSPIEFLGRGYRDHGYGTAPLGLNLRCRLRGRVLLEDAAYAFHLARPRDRTIPDEAHLIEATRDATQPVALERVTCDWSGRTPAMLEYPTNIAFANAAGEVLHLHNPRVIDSDRFCARLMYDAFVRGRAATALCEATCPPRP